MFKGLILFVSSIFFLIWVVAPSSPEERISRLCAPVTWIGNLAETGTSIVSPENVRTAREWNAKSTYYCQFTIWRLVYEDEYIQENEETNSQPIQPEDEQT